MSAVLSKESRQKAIEAMKNKELDILVIGGGIVGAGSALDAATRGLSTGIVEARDWASGTSSRSSKLIHGGLRYLEMLDFALVTEALKERGLLLQKIAPHLTRPVPFLYPLEHRFWERPYVTAGITLYDTLGMTSGNSRGVPMQKQYSRKGTLKIAPALKEDSVVGSIRYYDGQVDDARYNMEVVRTAVHYGAHAANRAEVIGLIKEGQRVVGAKVRDIENDEVFEVRAKQVVNATGVWTDETQEMVGEQGKLRVRASKGVHIVVPKDRIQSEVGFIFRTEKSVLFVIPWFGPHWVIGTTDTDWELDKAHPAATANDIDYILDHVNKVLKRPLTRDDVEGVFAGLRPLLAGESDSTAKLSREHVVSHPAPGIVMVAGGKWTTYRVMAKDAIDEAVRSSDSNISKSVTEQVPLIGAEGFVATKNNKQNLADEYGVNVAIIEHLLGRYGSNTEEVLEYIKENKKFGETIPGTENYILAEAAYAASHEGALHLEDILTRRTRISIEAWDRGVSAAPVVAEIMADILGLDEKQTQREVKFYEARVEAERKSQEQTDDESAEKVRLEAEDIVRNEIVE
ncbi:MAG: glycerol-3-phosphate dehydrogenase/oxidase [Micrococcaceae bacterium]